MRPRAIERCSRIRSSARTSSPRRASQAFRILAAAYIVKGVRPCLATDAPAPLRRPVSGKRPLLSQSVGDPGHYSAKHSAGAIDESPQANVRLAVALPKPNHYGLALP